MSKHKRVRIGSSHFMQKENRIILNFNRKEPLLEKSYSLDSLARSNSSHVFSNTLED